MFHVRIEVGSTMNVENLKFADIGMLTSEKNFYVKAEYFLDDRCPLLD